MVLTNEIHSFSKGAVHEMGNTTTLQIAVCEDTPADAARIKQHIENSGIPSEVSYFESGEDFLRSFRAERYDLVFMDIYMSGETGVQIAEKLRKTDKNTTLVFTTTSLDHTLESYRLKAVSYLEKPVQAEDIKEALELTLAKRKTRATITVTTEGGKNKDVPLDSIIFFEHQNHVVTLTTTTGVLRTIQAARLDEMEKRLPMPPFLRCHRSFIVNLNHVQKIDKDTHSFTMINGGRADIQQRDRLSK
jgi:DNA-binding LytR/AlgR family response regulator